jgi:aminoglycoside phosphotransferase (APT) family kinase protein
MNLEIPRSIVAALHLPAPITEVQFLEKGYSTDRKFLLHTLFGPEFVLRISCISETDLRRAQYDYMVQVRAAGVTCSEPVAFGVDSAHSVCYMVLTYMPGVCAEEALPTMASQDQYDIGRQAGEQLRIIHRAIEPPAPVDDFAVRGAKFGRCRSEAAELGFEFAGRKRAERYVDAHLDLLKDRPTVFRHGDFHPGNLIVEGARLSGVIDFNRSDFGDPVDDFYKTAWFGAPISPQYARGLLRAYFEGEPDAVFWRLYNLYVAAVLPADLVWTHRLFPEHLALSFSLAEIIARTHDFEAGGPPNWWNPAGAACNVASCCARL